MRATCSSIWAALRSEVFDGGGDVVAPPGLLAQRQHRTPQIFAYGDAVRVVNARGVARFGAGVARVVMTTASQLEKILRDEIEAATRFGDVARAFPDTYILHGACIADFCGLAHAEQIATLAVEEIGGCDPAAPVVVILVPSRG